MTAYKNVALNEMFLEFRGSASQLDVNVETTKWLNPEVGLERSLELFFKIWFCFFFCKDCNKRKEVDNFLFGNLIGCFW